MTEVFNPSFGEGIASIPLLKFSKLLLVPRSVGAFLQLFGDIIGTADAFENVKNRPEMETCRIIFLGVCVIRISACKICNLTVLELPLRRHEWSCFKFSFWGLTMKITPPDGVKTLTLIVLLQIELLKMVRRTTPS